jgi:hypothetical protein
METDVELTPGYRAWRDKVTRENKLARDEAFRREETARRLGAQALEQEYSPVLSGGLLIRIELYY